MTATVPYHEMSSTEPLFKKCCGCVPLRIGCFILGYLNLVLNTFHTLALLTLTTYIGITTHGFDHFDSRPRELSIKSPEVESVERPFLNQIGLLLLVILCANVAWLIVNVACLVGLHKRRPGPIRVYVAFATARLMLSLAGFIYLVMTATANTQAVVSHSIDLGLTAYFIIVYYVYAVQLERDEGEVLEVTQGPPVSDIAFIIPPKIDKETLVA
ncbi:hypothetical protein ABMA28_003090 [Loxostege sticticalis]|uniref:Uncharacterized protein n=1 Tax=Loxostege sticticalis TaxID=481309 RepID=A0ABD0SUZ8_LOXSC